MIEKSCETFYSKGKKGVEKSGFDDILENLHWTETGPKDARWNGNSYSYLYKNCPKMSSIFALWGTLSHLTGDGSFSTFKSFENAGPPNGAIWNWPVFVFYTWVRHFQKIWLCRKGGAVSFSCQDPGYPKHSTNGHETKKLASIFDYTFFFTITVAEKKKDPKNVRGAIKHLIILFYGEIGQFSNPLFR